MPANLTRNIKTSPTVTLTTLTDLPQNSPLRTLATSAKRSKSGAPTIISVWATIQSSLKLCSVYCPFIYFSSSIAYFSFFQVVLSTNTAMALAVLVT